MSDGGTMRRFVGLFVLMIVIIGVSGYALSGRAPEASSSESVTVVGSIGGEKSGLLADPEVVSILAERYGIEIDARVEGSLDMVHQPTSNQDFLWPSSEVALALYEERIGADPHARNVFNSPIVLYSWTEATEALTAKGLVAEHDGVREVDSVALAELLTNGSTPSWQDLGLEGINGKVDVVTTNPSRSNSGNMFAGLLSIAANGGNAPTAADLDSVGAKVVSYYGSLGELDNSSGDLFQSFLQLGVGSNQVIVGYENQLIEFGTAQPQFQETLTRDVQVLYPTPTVYSSHPIIPLTERGQRLIAAFEDPELLQIAWIRHGFRSGQLASANNPADLSFGVVPAQIRSVVPMPRPDYMQAMVERIS